MEQLQWIFGKKMMPSIGALVLVWQFFGEGEVKSKKSQLGGLELTT